MSSPASGALIVAQSSLQKNNVSRPPLRGALSPREAGVRECFTAFDADGDGFITRDEVVAALSSLGVDLNLSVSNRLLGVVDEDVGGAGLSFADFKDVLVEMTDEMQTSTHRSAFVAFDRDRNGLITAVELQLGMERMGSPVSLVEAADMIAIVDGDGDGMLNEEEFIELMRH